VGDAAMVVVVVDVLVLTVVELLVLVDEVELEVEVETLLVVEFEVDVLLELVLDDVLVDEELVLLDVEVVEAGVDVEVVDEVDVVVGGSEVDVEDDVEVEVVVSGTVEVVDSGVVVEVVDSGGAVDDEVDVEVVVTVDELVLVVVASGHQVISGASAVASPIQRAPVAESRVALRSSWPIVSWQALISMLLRATRLGSKSSRSKSCTSSGSTMQSGKAGIALLSAAASCACVKSSQHGHSSSGSTIVVLVVVEVDDDVDDDVELLVDVVIVVVVSGGAVDDEVDDEVVVTVDEVVVVPSAHHTTSGSMAVASPRQSAPPAESRLMWRVISPRLSSQNMSSKTLDATKRGSEPSLSTTCVGSTMHSGKAGVALFSAARSSACVKSSQHGHSSSGAVVDELVEVDVELLLDEDEDDVLLDGPVDGVVELDVEVEEDDDVVDELVVVLVVVLVDEVDDDVDVVLCGTVEVVVGTTSEHSSETFFPVVTRRAQKEPTHVAPLPMRRVALGARRKPCRMPLGASRTRLPRTLICGGTTPTGTTRALPFSSSRSSTTLIVVCAPASTRMSALRPALSWQMSYSPAPSVSRPPPSTTMLEYEPGSMATASPRGTTMLGPPQSKSGTGQNGSWMGSIAPVTEPLMMTLRPRCSEFAATLSTVEAFPSRTASPMMVVPSTAVPRLPRETRPSGSLAPRSPSTVAALFTETLTSPRKAQSTELGSPA
jgi:hypothetical protein